jgi:16S rRNA G966 N2-methylase RsmD
MGCEALSRGASHVTFVEQDLKATKDLGLNIRLILERLHKQGIDSPSCEVKVMDVMQFLKTDGRLFDLIWADPPYIDLPDVFDSMFELCCKRLKPQGLFMLEASIKIAQSMNMECIKSFGQSALLVNRNQ